MNKIPLMQQPERFRIQLGDVTVELRTRYFKTTDTWKMSVYKNNELLVAGISLLNGIDILKPYNLEIGSLGLIDLNTTHLDANSQTLGTSVILLHMSTEEYDTIIHNKMNTSDFTPMGTL